SEGELAKANLQKFYELVLKAEEDGFRDLVSLFNELDRLEETEEIGNAATGREAVTLMTIHKSKGLEFPFVILVGTGEPWEKRDLYWAKGDHPDFGPGMYYVGKK